MPETKINPKTPAPINAACVRPSLQREPATNMRYLAFELAYAQGFVILYPRTARRAA